MQLNIYFCSFNICLDWIRIFAKGSLIIFWSETVMIYHITCLIWDETKCCVWAERELLKCAETGWQRGWMCRVLQASWQSIVLNRDFNADRSCNASVKEELLKVLGEAGRHLFANSLMKAVNSVAKLRQASWERSARVRMLKLQPTVLQRKWSCMGSTAEASFPSFPSFPFFPFLPLPPFSLFSNGREKN